jgi:hypothetical protein
VDISLDIGLSILKNSSSNKTLTDEEINQLVSLQSLLSVNPNLINNTVSDQIKNLTISQVDLAVDKNKQINNKLLNLLDFSFEVSM